MYKSFIISVLFLSILSACVSMKSRSVDMKQYAKEIYFQQEVPGQQDARTMSYLKIVIQDGQSIILDSVKTGGKMINTQGIKARNNTMFRIRLASIPTDGKVTVFASNDKGAFETNIENVKTKTPLHLP